MSKQEDVSPGAKSAETDSEEGWKAKQGSHLWSRHGQMILFMDRPGPCGSLSSSTQHLYTSGKERHTVSTVLSAPFLHLT